MTTEDILLNSGGVLSNSLRNILSINDQDEDGHIEQIQHSPYYFEELIPKLIAHKDNFTILSSNINSIMLNFRI